MKAVFAVLLLVELAFSAPTADFNPTIISEAFFNDPYKIYESNHDIVKIYVPLNNINFDKNSKGSIRGSGDGVIFFIEADNNQGNQSLYIRINGEAKKLLDEARDIAAPYDDSKEVYFAAKDGLYIYDYEQNEAKKFGTINEDLIGIVCGKTNNTMFVLTAEKKVYKVTEEGTNLKLIDGIANAEQIVLDYANNLFYVDDNDFIYVVNKDGIQPMVVLPDNTKLTLIRPPFVLEKGIIVVIDKVVFIMYPDLTGQSLEIYIQASVTAFSVEMLAVQYYAFNNKIYRYDMSVIFGKMIEKDLKELSEDLLLNKQYEQLIKEKAHILRTEIHTQFVTEAPRFVTQE